MFAQLLLSAIKGSLITTLVNLLNRFRENNGDEKYYQLVAAIRNTFMLLSNVTDDTKTKIDDILVSTILESLPPIPDDFRYNSIVVSDLAGTEFLTTFFEGENGKRDPLQIPVEFTTVGDTPNPDNVTMEAKESKFE